MIRTIMYPLVQGLKKTFEKAFSKKITVQYPEEKREIPERFRGRPKLVQDENGKIKCVVCSLCVAVCPPQAITIEAAEGADPSIRYPEKYVIDLGRCIYCGYCEQVCPKEAIKLTREYELAQYDRSKLIYDLPKLIK
ncbi:NADH-quinone oxidoreductase subunit NuoI [Desulfothermus okinawensis JCM 13304]